MNHADPNVARLSWSARGLAVAQLMRVANVFTAVADVWMGMILATGELPGLAAVGITATTCLLYSAGMVLNDVFDHAVDLQERPERPIPSGRISLRGAHLLGWLLLTAGIAAGWWTSVAIGNFLPGFMTTLLALLILAYDGGLKKSLAGPAVMALCRVANVLLGMSLAAWWGESGIVFDAPLIPPLAIGLYVFSVTWFARNEAGKSPRWLLVLSIMGIGASLGFCAAMPWIELPGTPLLQVKPEGWLLLWGVVAALVLRRLVSAVIQPRPQFVQRAVGHAILSLIFIDAALVLGYGGTYWGLMIIALLAPATLLAQWFKVS